MITRFKELNESRLEDIVRGHNRSKGLGMMKMKYRAYDITNDKFIREVYCKEHAPRFLTEGKKYRVYSEFETGAMLSGKCLVVFTDNNEFIGFDSGYFMEEYQWTAAKRYNL